MLECVGLIRETPTFRLMPGRSGFPQLKTKESIGFMKNKASRSLSQNLAAQLIYQMSLYLVPFISTPYLSRVLGSDMIGRYSYARSIASYFILAAGFGTATYGQRLIASLQSDEAKQRQAFRDLALLRCIAAAVGCLLYGIAVVPGSVDPKMYLFVGLEIFGVAADITWYFQGREQFPVVAICNGTAKFLMVGLLFLFVKTPADVGAYACVYSVMTLVGGGAQWLFLPKTNRLAGGEATLLGREKGHIACALRLFVAQLAMQIYTVLDKTMIGLITHSESENGYYDQAQRLIRLVEAVCTVISPVIASRVAVLWSQGKKKEAADILDMSFRFVCCIGVPIVVGLQLIVKDFVPVYYGAGYEPVVSLLRVLSVLPLVIGLSNVIGIQFLVPVGQENKLTSSVAAGALVNVYLNLFLIRRMASTGAAIASVAAEVTVTAVQLYFVRGHLDIGKVFSNVLRYFLLSIPMALAGGLLSLAISSRLLRLALVVSVCGLVYLAELLLFRDPLVRFIKTLWFEKKSSKGTATGQAE